MNSQSKKTYLKRKIECMNDVFQMHPCPAFILDNKGNIRFFNSRFRDILNIDNNENVIEFIKSRILQRQELKTCLEKAFSGEYGEFNELWLDFPKKEISGEQDYVCFKVTSYPFHIGANNEIGAVIIICNDITEIKLCEKKFSLERQHNEQLTEEIKKIRNEMESFVYSISHDLKSPLLSIEGLLNIMLSSSDFPEGAISIIKRVKNNVEKMDSMINDLLELSRIGRLDPEPKKINILLIARQTAACKEELIKEKIDRVKFSGTEVEVFCAPERLSQVFSNLIDNAVKYIGDRPDPSVCINVTRKDGDALISVSDNGVGIESKFHEEIFLPFRRLTYSQKIPGNGMGLTIVKKIIENYGGNIWLESTPGEGTSIFFKLPACTNIGC